VSEKYYEVEGAVYRVATGKKMEIYAGGDNWKEYQGDPSRVLSLSNPMTLEDVKPHMEPRDPAA
jgi:hypothetical protein